MSGKIYAYLVGINEYKAAPRLGGCVNDVEGFEAYLKDRFGSNLALHTLKDGDATRANVIAGFEHLQQAEKDDVAFFLYCGHGAQSDAAPEFRSIDPSTKDEGIVCVDSRMDGTPDLADKELAVLLARVAKNDPHLAVMFDCCHSGSGTRDLDELQGARSRHTGVDGEARSLDSYLDGYYQKLYASEQRLYVPKSRHVLLAACKRTQKAMEKSGSGVFSATLNEVLATRQDRLPNYAQLFNDCSITVRKRATKQDPQIDAYEGFNAYAGFLGGQADPGVSARVFFDGSSWIMDKGAFTGLPSDPEKPTDFQLFAIDGDTPIATGRTASVESTRSVLAVDSAQLDRNAKYRAELTDVPLAPLPVFAEGDDPALETLRAELSTRAPDVVLVEEPHGTNFSVSVRTIPGGRQCYVLTRREPAQEFEGFAAASADASDSSVAYMVEALKGAARYERLAVLQNGRTQLSPSEIDFVLKVWPGTDREHRDVDGQLKMVYQESEAGREWDEIPVLVQATNTIQPTGNEKTDRENTRHVALFYFSERLGVMNLHNDELPPGATVPLWGQGAPGKLETLQLLDGKTETHDHFKLFVSTDKIPHHVMTQPDIPEKTRALGTKERGMGKPKVEHDWFTKSIHVRGVGVRNELSTQDDVAMADGDIVIKKHPHARAKVSLSTAPSINSRDVAAGVHQALSGFRLESFGGSTRDVDGGTIIELTDITNAESFAENPLEIDLAVELEEDEYILPMTFDGEHFLMVGPPSEQEDGRTRISIDHVPDSKIDEGRRSLGKSLKLYLMRTYLKQSVDDLRWVEFAADGSIDRKKDGMIEKIAEAKNVLLLVHGIIGDTENIAEGIATAKLEDGSELKEAFDLVLTFDYENLGREIQDTAAVLAAELERVGLGPDDGKRLTILAHSMGGLVSRHYIEQLGGGAVVDHLVMCGTPNGGSPFGKVDTGRKVLGVLAGVAMNVPALVPFGPAVGFMLRRSNNVTVTLEQMNASSAFLTKLNDSADPDVQYTVLAGNVREYHGDDEGLLAKLVTGIGKGMTLEALHGGSENHDIAVALESIRDLDELRKQKPVKVNVACHHLNYFSSDAGLDALGRVSW